MKQPQPAISRFLNDIAPCFDGRKITFADIGAGDGYAYAAAMASPLVLEKVLLTEMNPQVFDDLTQRVSHMLDAEDVQLLRLDFSDDTDLDAVSETQRAEPKEVTPYVPEHPDDPDEPDDLIANDDNTGDAAPTKVTLDKVLSHFPDDHISVLKVRCKGLEGVVLRGASKMLAKGAVDIIYIETVFGETNFRQGNIQETEELLNTSGYRVFGFYHDKNDQFRENGAADHIGVAFASPQMVRNFPLQLGRDLVRLQPDVDIYNQGLLKELEQARVELAEQKRRREEDLHKAHEEAQDRFNEVARVTKVAMVSQEQTAKLQEQTAKLQEQTAKQQQHAKELQTHNSDLRKHAGAMRGHADALRKTVDGVRKEKTLLKKQLDKTRRDLLSKERKVRDLTNSMSWRVTKPLRFLSRLVRFRR